MSQFLPYGNIAFCDEEQRALVAQEFLNNGGVNFRDEAEEGYCLEVDLHYPAEVHDFLSMFPPLAEKREITRDEYSSHTSEIVRNYGAVPTRTPKLVTDLGDKGRYHIHYRMLKLVLTLGVQLKAVHQVVR